MLIHTEDEAIAVWHAYQVHGDAGLLTALRQIFPLASSLDERHMLAWARSLATCERPTISDPRHITERA